MPSKDKIVCKKGVYCIRRKTEGNGVHNAYRGIFDIGYKVVPGIICVYCGDEATGHDHVPPLIMCSSNGLLYPACRECNCILNTFTAIDIGERKRELKRRLRNRYRKILKMPKWDDYELSELHPDMQKYIKTSMAIKDRILERLEY